MEDSQLDKPSDRDAELCEKRLAELADAVRDLRHAVEHGSQTEIDQAANDVTTAALYIDAQACVKNAIAFQINAIRVVFWSKPLPMERQCGLFMVAAIESMIEKAGE